MVKEASGGTGAPGMFVVQYTHISCMHMYYSFAPCERHAAAHTSISSCPVAAAEGKSAAVTLQGLMNTAPKQHQADCLKKKLAPAARDRFMFPRRAVAQHGQQPGAGNIPPNK